MSQQTTQTAQTKPAKKATFSRRNIVPAQLLAKADKTKLHPTVLAEAEHRAASVQLRVADAITSFAGSMRFVYLHVVVFAAWMIWFEPSPWPTLTLVVSLEAIFLSTFVMIGQNRQAAFQQAKADHDYASSEQLLTENTDLTRAIHQLTQEIHTRVLAEVQASLAADPTLSEAQARAKAHAQIETAVAETITEHKPSAEKEES